MRNMAVELLVQAYSTSILPGTNIPTVYLENASLIENRLNDYFRENAEDYLRQLIKIALHLSERTTPGYYALQFNKDLRTSFTELISLKLPYYQFDPYSIEEEALYQAFKEALTLASPRFFRNHGEESLEDHQVDDLYSMHYNRLILQVSGINATDVTSNRPRMTSCPKNVVIFKDGRRTFCLDKRIMLKSISGDKINPITGKKFSKETYTKLISEHREELNRIREE